MSISRSDFLRSSSRVDRAKIASGSSSRRRPTSVAIRSIRRVSMGRICTEVDGTGGRVVAYGTSIRRRIDSGSFLRGVVSNRTFVGDFTRGLNKMSVWAMSGVESCAGIVTVTVLLLSVSRLTVTGYKAASCDKGAKELCSVIACILAVYSCMTRLVCTVTALLDFCYTVGVCVGVRANRSNFTGDILVLVKDLVFLKYTAFVFPSFFKFRCKMASRL